MDIASASRLHDDLLGTTAVQHAYLGGVAPQQQSTAPQPRLDEEEEAAVRRARRNKARRAARAKARKDKDAGDKGDDDESDDEDEDDEDDEDASAARSREKARCQAIFAAATAAKVPGAARLAEHYAFRTTLPRGVAIAAMQAAFEALPGAAAAQPGRAPLDARMASEAIPTVAAEEGAGHEPRSAAETLAQRIVANATKLRGKAA